MNNMLSFDQDLHVLENIWF